MRQSNSIAHANDSLSKSPRSASRSAGRSSGFTLVEALVALTVVAMSLAAIGSVVNATSHSRVYVERHLAEVETAQQILAGLPDRDRLTGGTLRGEMAGHAWRLDATPFHADFVGSGANGPWAPEKLLLTVRGPGGAPLSIETIRLVKPRAR
jgi:general secretion pathway protein I